MVSEHFDRAAHDVLAVLPARARDVQRLHALARRPAQPTVTVIGKYNHGKSRLLNELLGRDAFAVSDRRETTDLVEHVHKEVRWLDAPGLDADVGQSDDFHARQAAWLESDIRLFVHAAKEGELDAAERTLLQVFHADDARTHRQTMFVLTQVDQLGDEAHLEQVTNAIRAQVPGTVLHPVSATRHRQGVEQAKALLVKRSGIPTLQSSLRSALALVQEAREHEAALLSGELREELTRQLAGAKARLDALVDAQRRQCQDFDQGLVAVLAKVCSDLQPVLQVTGTDHALVPDSFENMFKLTAGKRERARIQIAYSHACIAINGHLVRHGVVGLPIAQQTTVRSLDTVMVAVMGVGVKYRDDLRRIFCEQAGQERLRKEFSHYFELSQDRVELARQIARVESDIAAVGKALAAVLTLETGAG